MRVITGSARGARLSTLDGLETRPTAERIKEAVFSMIQFEIEGRRVLDLFAGSGQLGIEALSRGAASAVFVDAAAAAVKVVRDNLSHVRLEERASVRQEDAFLFLGRQAGPFDIAFVDPPYSQGLAERALAPVCRRMSPGGVVICETAGVDAMPEETDGFRLCVKRDYGKTAIRVYRAAAD